METYSIKNNIPYMPIAIEQYIPQEYEDLTSQKEEKLNMFFQETGRFVKIMTQRIFELFHLPHLSPLHGALGVTTIILNQDGTQLWSNYNSYLESNKVPSSMIAASLLNEFSGKSKGNIHTITTHDLESVLAHESDELFDRLSYDIKQRFTLEKDMVIGTSRGEGPLMFQPYLKQFIKPFIFQINAQTDTIQSYTHFNDHKRQDIELLKKRDYNNHAYYAQLYDLILESTHPTSTTIQSTDANI